MNKMTMTDEEYQRMKYIEGYLSKKEGAKQVSVKFVLCICMYCTAFECLMKVCTFT